jgi:triosephosphate isomerase (TIM)
MAIVRKVTVVRKKIVAGNWKMNLGGAEARELAESVVRAVGDPSGVDVVICPPFTALEAVSDAVAGSPVALGAQNMHWELKGAYTGEIAPNMLLTLGCTHVILGHSERRAYFHETDATVALKHKVALEAGLIPIVCVGETKEQREDGVTEQIIGAQVRGAFEGLDAESFEGTVVAYEPVWAIGTGLTATTEQAQDVHRFIRGILVELFGKDTAESTRIQYGGSVKADNSGELFSQPDIDGGLIGGAALNAESFKAIVTA